MAFQKKEEKKNDFAFQFTKQQLREFERELNQYARPFQFLKFLAEKGIIHLKERGDYSLYHDRTEDFRYYTAMRSELDSLNHSAEQARKAQMTPEERAAHDKRITELFKSMRMVLSGLAKMPESVKEPAPVVTNDEPIITDDAEIELATIPF